MDPEDGNLTLTNFTVDPDYACTMFQSCAKVSIVASASLQSSEAFLDFLVSKTINIMIISICVIKQLNITK